MTRSYGGAPIYHGPNHAISPRRLRALFLGLFLAAVPLQAQTDETIFREFQFDFSTPGARANGLGRAFVGLADEATAAYNNPAGLSVLRYPEFSIEYRNNTTDYEPLSGNDTFQIQQGTPTGSSIDLERIGYTSFSMSVRSFNFSAFYVNNLDYQREPVRDELFLLNPDRILQVAYLNEHDVRKIQMNTFGLGASRNFGKLSLGVAAAMAKLDLDFEYRTSLNSGDLGISDPLYSRAQGSSFKPAWVFGALYRLHPTLNLGLTYKFQPRFVYTESVNNNEFPTVTFPDGQPIPITFKIPDSAQFGLAWQPNDFWTVLFDVDWVRYEQLLDDFTILSRIRGVGPFDPNQPFFRFDEDDFVIGDRPDLRFGIEHLYPYRGNIFAFRGGAFLDPDHKTRFVGVPQAGEDPDLYDVQHFIFNSDDPENNVGYTAGLGFVWKNNIQVDVAYVTSDRFTRVVSSFLYRF